MQCGFLSRDKIFFTAEILAGFGDNYSLNSLDVDFRRLMVYKLSKQK